MRQLRERHGAILGPNSSARRASWALGRFCFVNVSVFALLCLIFVNPLRADTISGTVKDASGGVVIAAHIQITGGNLPPLVLTTDESGKFVAPNLAAGKYEVRVAKEGFDELVVPVDLKGAVDLALKLTITAQQISVTVNEKKCRVRKFRYCVPSTPRCRIGRHVLRREFCPAHRRGHL